MNEAQEYVIYHLDNKRWLVRDDLSVPEFIEAKAKGYARQYNNKIMVEVQWRNGEPSKGTGTDVLSEVYSKRGVFMRDDYSLKNNAGQFRVHIWVKKQKARSSKHGVI